MTVTISGPAGLGAGATGTYTITATRAANPSSKMGMNVAASQGSLAVTGVNSSQLQLAGSELTHLGPNSNLVTTGAGGTGSYSFSYTMPAGAGGTASTLYGVARIAFAGGWRHAANLTVATRPAAPAIGTGIPGNGTASVAFTAPANGGSAITGYTANCGGFTNTGLSSPIIVPGLTNGTSYVCSVTATNLYGTSVSSGTVSVTPLTVPGPPVIGTPAPGNTQIGVAFTAPASNGGSAILDYTANCGGFTATGAGSPVVVPGLTNGVAYTCTVTARNAAGSGSASAASASATPRTVPGAPTIGVATPGNAQISVAFTAPASNGGSAILDYTANCGGTTATGAGSPVVVTGLVNGSPYTCTVTARNIAGNGSASAASNSATPAGPSTFTLSVTKSGAGSGTVASSPAGISCGATCSAGFAAGASVVLTPTPAADSFFAGWTGACTGTGACNVTMDAAKSVDAQFKLNTTIPRLANISTRMQVLTGNDVLIGGFIIGGTTPKTVVVRARGPSLIPFGITNALANPTMQLFSGQTVIASNDDFGTAGNLAALNATGFAPSNAQESAILTTLGPGAYTAVVSGFGNTTGVGIIEVFEVDHPETPLANISTRGQVLTGGDVMIGGFVIQGDAPQTVVIRARGPSLVPFGITNALADPVLQLFTGQTLLDSNDDWPSSPNAAAIQSSGFAPSDPKEAVIRITLPPGAYTAIVSGKNGGTGVGIIEVFAQ